MNKVWAVALLDFRRLGSGLVSAALVAGLIPSLASGMGATLPASTILLVAFIVVGSATGGHFGNDFVDGKASFYFARPLPVGTLILGRIVGLIGLGFGVLVAFSGSYGLSRGHAGFDLSGLATSHAIALTASWVVSLYGSLAIAASGGARRHKWSMADLVRVPLGLAVSLGGTLLVFGLLADLAMRAYPVRPSPMLVLFGSLVVAAAVASWAGIAGGRTERLRIARFQNGVMFGQVGALAIGVVAAWTYVLHPGPQAIQRVTSFSGSPDGRLAYVRAQPGRGEHGRFSTMFVVDVASGSAQRLDVDPGQGPWVSADGMTVVWSEATPYFFRPLLTWLGRSSNYRVKTGAGDPRTLRMPSGVEPVTTINLLRSGEVRRVLPAPGGDAFAFQWGDRLALTSGSGGELAEADLGPGNPQVTALIFLAKGTLRLALIRGVGAAAAVEFADVDPSTGALSPLMTVAGDPRVTFDAAGSRALLKSRKGTVQSSISLVSLGSTVGESRERLLVDEAINPDGVFLADGRIAVTAGDWKTHELRIFSASGQPELSIPIEGGLPLMGNEMFPGILAVRLHDGRQSVDLGLFDTVSGALVRRVANGLPTLIDFLDAAPPPGSPSARLFRTADGQLFELPSPTAEPRLLLPLRRP